MEDKEDDGLPKIKLSWEDKLRIHTVWINSIIIKPYGKFVPYRFLDYKIKHIWKSI